MCSQFMSNSNFLVDCTTLVGSYGTSFHERSCLYDILMSGDIEYGYMTALAFGYSCQIEAGRLQDPNFAPGIIDVGLDAENSVSVQNGGVVFVGPASSSSGSSSSAMVFISGIETTGNVGVSFNSKEYQYCGNENCHSKDGNNAFVLAGASSFSRNMTGLTIGESIFTCDD